MSDQTQPRCRCGVPDWLSLRDALGWSVKDVAAHLGVSIWRIYWYQRSPHVCPPLPIVRLLHHELRRPSIVARLRALDYPNPAIGSRRRDTRLCSICGVPNWIHSRCPACSEFLCHEPLVRPGYCECGYYLA